MKPAHSLRNFVISVFLFSFVFHLIGLNQVGRTWDEQFKVDLGYIGWSNLLHGNFAEEYWMDGIEHPMIAKYVYGAVYPLGMIDVTPPIASTVSLLKTIAAKFWIPTQILGRIQLVPYDFTAPRLLSALFNSVTVTLAYVFASEFAGPLLAFSAPIALLLTPRFLVMGQLVTFESLSAMLLMLVIYFLKRKKIVIVSLLTALAFWSRYTNAYFVIFIVGYLWYNRPSKQELKIWILLPLIMFAVGMFSWPLLWHRFPHFLIRTFAENSTRGIGPSLYFLKYLLFTTPIPILFYAVYGLFRADRLSKWWAVSALVFFTLFSVPGGGTRYIFVIYPAIALLVTFGVRTLTERSRKISMIVSVVSLVWMSVGLARYYPYYLDYYNELIGGVSGAARAGYDISWWGEGQREAAAWIRNHTLESDQVALLVTPKYVFPAVFFPHPHLLPYGEGLGSADYLVVSRPDLLALTPEKLRAYIPIHEIKVAGSETLITIFKKK